MLETDIRLKKIRSVLILLTDLYFHETGFLAIGQVFLKTTEHSPEKI